MYAAINSAMRECPGEWFSYINDDDRLERGFGEMLREHCVPANERVIAYGRVDMIDEAGRRLYGFPSTGRAGDIAALWCEGIMPFTQQGMIAHRSVWDAVGGFDENYRYSGDLDFWVRARQCGFRFKYYNKTVACWRIRRGQLSANKAGVRRETTRALTPVMAHPPSWWRRLSAKARFRLVNIPCYLGRWARLGRLRQSEVFN
jgi:GT2 family glycosyltransferase